jgi:uncharacterized membrane protein YdjX (TVP38/TMEM64 family)
MLSIIKDPMRIYSSRFHSIFSKKNRWALLLTASFIGLLFASLLVKELSIENITTLISILNEQLVQHPFILLAALAFLPGIGFPISPLLILLGTSLSPQYGLIPTCILGVAMQSFCTTWSFLLANGPLKNALERWLRKRYTLPTLESKGAITATLLLRLAPGFPYALQNVILGLIGVPLKTYLLVSLPITGLITSIFIVSGAAIIQANKELLLIGFTTLVLVLVCLRIVANKLKQHAN